AAIGLPGAGARGRSLGARSRGGARAQEGAGGLMLWEVFVRPRRGLSHVHVGSLHAADAEQALQNARDVFTRREEGVSIWVVPSNDVVATTPEEKDAFFDPAG